MYLLEDMWTEVCDCVEARILKKINLWHVDNNTVIFVISIETVLPFLCSLLIDKHSSNIIIEEAVLESNKKTNIMFIMLW